MQDADKKIINKTLAGEKQIKSMEKLKREKLEVSINPKRYLLEHSKEELEKLLKVDSTTMTKDEKELLELSIKNYQNNIEEYSNAKLEAVMVPLRYKDLQAIKDGVLEALKYSREFNWDDDIKMRAMIREEHTLTVYLSLKKKDDITQRYYQNLELIAQETETTVNELYGLYLDNFVMTDEERKNS